MKVKNAMSRHVEFVGPRTTIHECARRMRQLDIGALPVRENGKLVGIVTDRDICCRALGEVGDGRDPNALEARDIMTRTVASCHEDDDCRDAARLMSEKHLRRLAVRDRNEAVVGLLSVDDLARHSRNLAGAVIEAAAPSRH